MARLTDTLTTAAKALEDVEEGIACAGTTLESRTYEVDGKTFLFLGAKDARLKLAASAQEASEFAKTTDSAVRIGTGGWTTISLLGGKVPSDAVLRKWVKESHSLYRATPAKPPTEAKRASAPTKARTTTKKFRRA